MADREVVITHCSNCHGEVYGPKDFKGLKFCKQECQTEYIRNAKAKISDAETDKFLSNNPTYYDCPYNNKLIVDLLAAWKLEPDAANLDSAYSHLLAERKLLGKLTMADINKMSSPEYDARERLDPQLGGALAEVEARGNAKFTPSVIHTTGGTGGWESMAKANLAQRQADADARAANRYRGSR
jgi:hypothetical protein